MNVPKVSTGGPPLIDTVPDPLTESIVAAGRMVVGNKMASSALSAK